MLVGEHGRVIPFRYFKAITVTVVTILLLSLAGVAVLSVRYGQQSRSFERLQKEFDDLKAQTAQLRNEKDVLLTKLVINSAQPSAENTKVNARGTSKAALTAAVNPSTPTPKPSPSTVPREPAAAAATQVRWQADIRQFELNYQQRQERLEASFRVYNTTNPRKPLSGTIVTVFKKSGDSSVQWLTVPAVPLREGVPSPDGGQAFSINNYRTMRFNTDRLKIPITYDKVTIFVFEAGGSLLLTRDFEIDIPAREPPAAGAPTNPAPAGAVSGGAVSADIPKDPQGDESVARPEDEVSGSDLSSQENQDEDPLEGSIRQETIESADTGTQDPIE